MKIATFINAHKILVAPVVLALMWAYDNWSTEAFLYLSLHGTYAVLWLLKYALFRDASFEERLPLWMGVAFVFLPLAGYYAAPFLLISRQVVVPPPWVGLAVAIFVLGIFLHYVSDAQKSFTLRMRKGLITDGLFARTRNPNYLGEFLIYLSFAILSQHWLPFVVLAGWGTSFVVRMRRKDRSLSRHEEFAAYRARTGLFLPHLGESAAAAASAGQPAAPPTGEAG